MTLGLHLPVSVTQGKDLLVSLQRIQKFLLLEEKVPDVEKMPRKLSSNEDILQVADVRASWTMETASSDVSSPKPFSYEGYSYFI